MDELFLTRLLQYISLLFSFLILVGSFYLESMAEKVGKYFEFIIVGFISLSYYILVLFFPTFKGHIWSAVRSAVILTETFWWIFRRMRENKKIKILWRNLWKRL